MEKLEYTNITMSGLGWRLVAVVGGDGQDFMSDLMNFVDQGLGTVHGLGVASLALVANLHHGAAVVALHTAHKHQDTIYCRGRQ